MNAGRLKVPCPHCSGTGQIDPGDRALAVLEAIETRRRATIQEVADDLNLPPARVWDQVQRLLRWQLIRTLEAGKPGTSAIYGRANR